MRRTSISPTTDPHDHAPWRWRTSLVATAVALTLSLGGTVAAQEATPTAADCVPLEEGDGCLPTAPESARVDLAEPTFSNPTAITNPLFPISDQAHLLQLGVDAGGSLRAEASVMPETKTITWNGAEIETTVSQFVAYADGRVIEVAYDFFAQDDAGNVWYFGEDVFNYEDGVVANTEGTWLAGKDGPAGMIMPAKPTVGDVYRPENIPDFVFEEVTVIATGVTVNGPRGPVDGAIQVQELLQDGTTETKHFAPGYGEFDAIAGSEFLVAAVSLPIDATSDRMPSELAILAGATADISEAAASEGWEAVAETTALISTVWEVAQAGDIPPVLALQMDTAVESLEEAADAEDLAETRQAAIAVNRATIDLQLPYRPLTESDLDTMALWCDQLALDAEAEDAGGVSGDVAAMEAVWARLSPSLDVTTTEAIAAILIDLRAAADEGDLATATEHSHLLRRLLHPSS